MNKKRKKSPYTRHRERKRKRITLLPLPFSDYEWTLIEQLASEAGMTTEVWLRKRLIAAARATVRAATL